MSLTAASADAIDIEYLPDAGLSDATITALIEATIDVDQNPTDLRPFLRRIAAEGLADLGLPGTNGTLTDQIAVIGRVAQECVSSAFVLWVQRMAAEYVVTYGSETTNGFGDQLRTAARPGVSAMAAAFRDASGSAAMPITFRRERDDIVLSGPINWASNLHDDALVVTVARELTASTPGVGDRIVVVVPISTPGVTVQPANHLLALDSSRSGSLTFAGARVPTANIVAEDVSAFVASVKPTFLTLQSAFCLGLATSALNAVSRPAGVAGAMCEEYDRVVEERQRIESTLVHLAGRIGEGIQPATRDYVRTRLDVALLAGSATRLELCLTGGRGYVATSSTARRVREALFLPIQSPTESELRWELSHSD